MHKNKIYIILVLLLLPLALSSCLEKKFNPGILNDESVSIESHPTYDKDSLYLDIDIISNEDFDIVYPAFEIAAFGHNFAITDYFNFMHDSFQIQYTCCHCFYGSMLSDCGYFDTIPQFYLIKPDDTLSLSINIPRSINYVDCFTDSVSIINIFEKGNCERFRLSICTTPATWIEKIFNQTPMSNFKNLKNPSLEQFHDFKLRFVYPMCDKLFDSQQRKLLKLSSKNYTHHFALSFEY